MNMRNKSTGVVYRIVRTATHVRTGEKSVTPYGAYVTFSEADRKMREDEEAMGEPEYEYEYKIVPALPEDFSK
jgi:hypothetical protein